MNSLLVISSYPKRSSIHGKSTVGIASYAKNTLLSLKKFTPKKTKITVLAEKLPDDTSHVHNGIEVKRLWVRESYFAMANIFREIISKHKDIKTVLIELELSMFGGITHLLPFPLFIFLLRIIGKQVVIVSHQVVPNINEIGPHINISDHTFSSIIYAFGLRVFYTTLLFLSSKVIVFEDILKNKLSAFGNTRKIKVIPHGVERFEKLPTKTIARKKLEIKKSEFVAVSFGYLAWYKGSDWLTHAVGEVNKSLRGKKIRLILAGGPNPNHVGKAYYDQYLKTLMREANKNGITITGFIEQKDIPLYYQAADVVILPYRTFMSASGPLSIAFSFKKPFLISTPAKGFLAQEDIQMEFKRLRIKEDTLLFKLNDKSLKKTLINLKNNSKLQKKLITLSTQMAKKRSWDVIGRKYYEEIFK